MKRIRLLPVLLAVSLAFIQFTASSYSEGKKEFSLTPCAGVPYWGPGTPYAVGTSVVYGGRLYRVLVQHTSQVGWEPPNVPALYADLGKCD